MVKRSKIIQWRKSYKCENKQSAEYRRDKRFFIMLYLLVALYGVTFALVAYYNGPKLDAVAEKANSTSTSSSSEATSTSSSDVVDEAFEETVASFYQPLDETQSDTNATLVWNPYRGYETTQEELDADIAWASQYGQ